MTKAWLINEQHGTNAFISLFFIGATFQGIEIGDGLASKSNGLFSAEDWQCGKVGVTVQKGRGNSE